MIIRKPAFSKNFALTETQRGESGAWIFIGNWVPACKLNNRGSQRVLCVPPGDDPLAMDWSPLRGMCATVWLYCEVDMFQLVVCLRSAGVKDIAILDRRTGELHLAHTNETEAAVKSLREVA